MLRFRGAQDLRQRVALATITGRPIRIDDIRVGEQSPGLRDYEACLLRLVEKVTNGCIIEINETGESARAGGQAEECVGGRLRGPAAHAPCVPCPLTLPRPPPHIPAPPGTSLRYKPGFIVGGGGLEHDCGTSRGMGGAGGGGQAAATRRGSSTPRGRVECAEWVVYDAPSCLRASRSYFLEPLTLIALWGKRPLGITLHGVTTAASRDPGVDTWRTVTLPLLRAVITSGGGDEAGSLELKVQQAGRAARVTGRTRRRPSPTAHTRAQVVRRGAPPGGGGEVLLRLPVLRALPPLSLTDEGLVRRVRGVAFSCRVSPQVCPRDRGRIHERHTSLPPCARAAQSPQAPSQP